MYSFVDTLKGNRPLTSSVFQIILLEDDRVDYELIEATLRNGGVNAQLTQVSDRPSFLKRLNDTQPDLILADYVLLKFEGLEALGLAQELCPDVPFILISGVLGEEQATRAMRQGATDYVLKQRLERLVPAVQRALRESQERQERQSLAMALQQTDNLLRTIVDESPVSIITLSRDQRVITWNVAAEKLYGWSVDAVVDQPLPLIPDSQRSIHDVCFSQALQARTISNHECQHLKQNGSLVDVDLSLAPLRDAEGYVYSVVMMATDITARKQIEAQRINLLAQESEARAAAESANQLKDEFLAVLSHELRTPLNAIVGWIKLIQKGNLKPPVLQKAIDTIERNAIAQTQLIEDLLDLSRIMRGQVQLHLRQVNVATLLGATVDTLRPAAEAKSIQVRLDTGADVAPILADPNRLQQVFWNLLSNAIKFTPASGEVAIQLSVDDDHLQIQVKDSGMGITPDFLPHVFDYFRQADGSSTRSQGGLGLGLAITRRLVELHGGMITVDSPGLNQGTTFTVSLPQRMTPPNNETPIAQAAQNTSGEIVDNAYQLIHTK
jgi:PAS domain S-box-containing protein